MERSQVLALFLCLGPSYLRVDIRTQVDLDGKDTSEVGIQVQLGSADTMDVGTQVDTQEKEGRDSQMEEENEEEAEVNYFLAVMKAYDRHNKQIMLSQ